MDYSDQVLKSEIHNLETQIKRDRKILKAYQQNVQKKTNDIHEANIKLEQLKRRMIYFNTSSNLSKEKGEFLND